MSSRASSFIGMVLTAGFLGAAWCSGDKGGMLLAMFGTVFLAPFFAMMLRNFIRGDE